MAAISSDAISSALKVIRDRLADVERDAGILAEECRVLKQAEQSLLAVSATVPAQLPAEASGQPKRRLESGSRSSLRAQLLAAVREAGHEGQTVAQLRSQFPDAKGGTLAATLSNLKRAGLIDTNGGTWFARETPKNSERPSSGGGSEMANVYENEPERWHAADYEVITHPRTGVSLARRA